MNMYNINELQHLLAAKTKCIWIKSHEEARVIKEIKKCVVKNQLGFKIKAISQVVDFGSQELSLINGIPDKPATKNMIDRVYKEIYDLQSNQSGQKTIYIFKDFHLLVDNKNILRGLRDIMERPKTDAPTYVPIIVISPTISIPLEHEKLFSIIDFETPKINSIRDTIASFASKVNAAAEKKGYLPVSKETIEECSNLAVGLTGDEISSYLRISLQKYKTVNPEIFLEARISLINKTGLLELMKSNITMEDMGGNHEFKKWIDDVALSMSPEALEFGVEKSKGFVGIGIPGTAKTLSAEMIASKLNLPLIKFDAGKVMNSYVGRTEQNMQTALSVIKACSPCVLLIDEIEKNLSGMESSGKVDGGTMARVIGSLLQFLSSKDSEDVFTVMTSNNIADMPPELTRSGRLDTIWYFGLPTEEERKEIFKIHFSKKPIEVSEDVIEYGASITENLTGAEIKELVKISMRKAYKRYLTDNDKTVKNSDIKEALKEIVPIYKTYNGRINYLEKYAEGRARHASSKEEKKSKKTKTLKIGEINQ